MTASPSEPTDPGAQISPADAWGKPTLRHLLTNTDRFVTVVELVTSRGLVTEQGGRRVLSLDPEPELIAQIEDKQQDGLDGATSKNGD